MQSVDHLADALDAIAPQVLELCHAPGISVAVGVGEDVVLARGYGHADLSTGRPMDPATVGPTGSDAKPYTAAAALQLVDRGVLDLDEPVNDHLGDLRIVNPHGERPITLRDLLTHRSGLGTTVGFCDLVPPPPLGDHLRRVFARGTTDAYDGELFPLWATPVGQHYQYSNTGIAVVGYLVERTNPDGVPFGEWVRRHLYEPLGMTSSCFPPAPIAEHVPPGILERRSAGYATLEGLQLRLPPIFVGDHPAGSALTTPSDHVRFLLAIAGEGRLGDAAVLRPETAREMITPQATRGFELSSSVGLVWNVFDHGDEHTYFGHGGEYMWGWHSVARAWPNQRAAVNVQVNQFDLGDQGTSDRPSHLAGRLVLDVVDAWVRGHDPRPRRDEAASRSHLAGLMIADRLIGRLGIPTAYTDDDIAATVGDAVVAPTAPWDPAAFASAMRHARSTERGLLASAELWRAELPAHLRDLVARQLGVPGLAKLADLSLLT
ncbi:MAG TPA: serine hydrolase domain-containing protein [Acidimicrobiales bacterium]|nr:serine hydrolase domain-containing protein [Acidimicrobiales bacterium]